MTLMFSCQILFFIEDHIAILLQNLNIFCTNEIFTEHPSICIQKTKFRDFLTFEKMRHI